jgi:hypothetical protein
MEKSQFDDATYNSPKTTSTPMSSVTPVSEVEFGMHRSFATRPYRIQQRDLHYSSVLGTPLPIRRIDDISMLAGKLPPALRIEPTVGRGVFLPNAPVLIH